MLQVRWQHNSLITGLTRKLHTEVPRVERDKREFQVLADQVFLREGIEAIDNVTERPGTAHMLPCQRCETGYYCNRRQLVHAFMLSGEAGSLGMKQG